MSLGFVIPDNLIPPDPDPGPDNDNDQDDVNNDGELNVNEDEENNERNCETPRGFSGDILENESETSLLSRLEDRVNGDDDGEEACMNEDEEDTEINDNHPCLNTAQESQVENVLNNGGSGKVYSMKELFSHINEKNLPLRSRNLVKPDGNCFFESCEDLARKFDLPVPHDKHLLRRLITDSMPGHPDFLEWVQIHFHGEISDFEECIARLRKDGQFTDGYGLTTLTAAHVFGNDYRTKYL